MNTQLYALLSKVGLKEEAILALGQVWTKEINIAGKDFLIQPGRKENHLYFILSGTFRIYIEAEKEEVCVGFGYPNTLLTSFDAFVSEGSSGYFIQAIKKSKLIAIKRSDFYQFINGHLEFAQFWYRMLEQVLVSRMEREVDLLCLSPKDRFDKLMIRSPHLFQLVPQKHIASYLAMQPETLSRLKKLK